VALRNRVRELRAVLGKGELSQKELAERAGIDPSTLSDIENNRTNPNAETCLAIARVLGVSMDDLFLPADTDGVSVEPNYDIGDQRPSPVTTGPSRGAVASISGDRTGQNGGTGK
jgi:putative transcriptional regulator